MIAPTRSLYLDNYRRATRLYIPPGVEVGYSLVPPLSVSVETLGVRLLVWAASVTLAYYSRSSHEQAIESHFLDPP
jgi:hypothetical protein